MPSKLVDQRVAKAMWARGARNALPRRAVLHAGDMTHRGMSGLSKFRSIRTPPVIPSAGRNRAVTNRILAKKGRYAAGAVAGVTGLGYMRGRRVSGLDPSRGRPTGPYVY